MSEHTVETERHGLKQTEDLRADEEGTTLRRRNPFDSTKPLKRKRKFRSGDNEESPEMLFLQRNSKNKARMTQARVLVFFF